MREWLVEKRKNQGLTCADVGEKIGLHESTIGKYENGILTPKPATAKKLGKLLKFNWTKFYENTK